MLMRGLTHWVECERIGLGEEVWQQRRIEMSRLKVYRVVAGRAVLTVPTCRRRWATRVMLASLRLAVM